MSEQEYREFWVDPTEDGFITAEDFDGNKKEYATGICFSYYWPHDTIHVIEYKAFQAAQDKIQQLEKQNEIYRKALEFYANHESVIKEAYHSNDQGQITCVHTFINHVAADALKDAEGVK